MTIRRQTTNTDLRRLRDLAASGVSVAAAARQVGMHRDSVRYWGRKLVMNFIRDNRYRAPAAPVPPYVRAVRL